jgi:replication factor A1
MIAETDEVFRYDTTGQTTTFKSHSAEGGGGGAGAGSFKKDAFITLEAAQDGQIGMSEKPDYFSTRATVSFTKPENLSYPACPTDRCNKKVSMEGDNMWRCEKCDLTHEAPEYRYVAFFSSRLPQY